MLLALSTAELFHPAAVGPPQGPWIRPVRSHRCSPLRRHSLNILLR
jgi:hypothetical protein